MAQAREKPGDEVLSFKRDCSHEPDLTHLPADLSEGQNMHWEFKQERGETHRWRWRCVAEGTRETLRMSQLPFKTMEECVRDAEKYGYVARDHPPSAVAR